LFFFLNKVIFSTVLPKKGTHKNRAVKFLRSSLPLLFF
jgi:hypothetical protein